MGGADYVKRTHSTYLKLHPKNKDTNLRFFRISAVTVPSQFESPKADDYEDKWNLL